MLLIFQFVIFIIYIGLGSEWGAPSPVQDPRDAVIKELGSHLLQVYIFKKNIFEYAYIEYILIINIYLH